MKPAIVFFSKHDFHQPLKVSLLTKPINFLASTEIDFIQKLKDILPTDDRRFKDERSLYRIIISPIFFDRMPFEPKIRLTERHLAEHHFTERSFDRITI
jgi:hypothetical protein